MPFIFPENAFFIVFPTRTNESVTIFIHFMMLSKDIFNNFVIILNGSEKVFFNFTLNFFSLREIIEIPVSNIDTKFVNRFEKLTNIFESLKFLNKSLNLMLNFPATSNKKFIDFINNLIGGVKNLPIKIPVALKLFFNIPN